MTDVGAIYVASRQLRFLCEAIASAESVKAVSPGLSITLFTDIPYRFEVLSTPFDAIIPIKPQSCHSNLDVLSWGIGLNAKVWSMRHSPYRRTLYLDTDTRALQPLERIFDTLDTYSLSMVPCDPDTSISCRLYGPMFNTGVIAYRRDDQTARLFADWVELNNVHLEAALAEPPTCVPYLARFDDATRRLLLVGDQVSLASLVNPSEQKGVMIKALEPVWNARNRKRSDLDDVIIDHASCHKIAPRDVTAFMLARQRSQGRPHE